MEELFSPPVEEDEEAGDEEADEDDDGPIAASLARYACLFCSYACSRRDNEAEEEEGAEAEETEVGGAIGAEVDGRGIEEKTGCGLRKRSTFTRSRSATNTAAEAEEAPGAAGGENRPPVETTMAGGGAEFEATGADICWLMLIRTYMQHRSTNNCQGETVRILFIFAGCIIFGKIFTLLYLSLSSLFTLPQTNTRSSQHDQRQNVLSRLDCETLRCAFSFNKVA